MKAKSKFAAIFAACGAALATAPVYAQVPTERQCTLEKFATEFKSNTYADSCTKVLQDDTLSKEDRAETIFLRSLWYRERRRYREAEADLRVVLSMFPNHARATNRLGDVLFEGYRNYPEARRWILRSIELDPKRPYAYVSLGYIEQSAGRNEEAVEAFARAIKIKPSYAWARRTRAKALEYLQRWDEVMVETAYLAEKSNKLTDIGLVSIHQRNIDMRFDAALMHGRALRAKNSYDAAEKWYDALVAEYPNSIALVERSKFLSGLPIGGRFRNRGNEALADVENAIKLDPKFAAAYRQKATLLRLVYNRPKEALEHLDRAIKLRRVDYATPYLVWEQALNLRRLGKPIEASAKTLNAIYQSPQVGSPFANSILKRFADHGYFVPPKTPDRIQQAIEDAVTACMHDERCS